MDIKMTTQNVGAQGLSWTVFGAECLGAVYDLRWMIIFAIVLIGTDFWWGCRENSMLEKKATTRFDREKFKFHFSQAGRRTLNKAVDYLTYLLVGCVAGLAITEPMGIATHTTTAAVGLGFGCLFEISSIVGHIGAVKGINIRLNLKRLIVAIIKKKNEDIADILDEGIEEIEDNTRKPEHEWHYNRHRGDCSISTTYDDDMHHHCGEDINDKNDIEDESTAQSDEGI